MSPRERAKQKLMEVVQQASEEWGCSLSVAYVYLADAVKQVEGEFFDLQSSDQSEVPRESGLDEMGQG